PIDAVERDRAAVEREAARGIDREGAETERMPNSVDDLTVALDVDLRVIEVRIGARLPEVRIGDRRLGADEARGRRRERRVDVGAGGRLVVRVEDAYVDDRG